MSRVFFVVDVDYDFKGDMSEAATWLECHLDRGQFTTKVIAYRSLNDLVFDFNDKEGAFKNELGKQPMPKLTPLPEAPAWVPATLKETVDQGFKRLVQGSEPDLTIPDFLKRDAKDKADRAEIEAQQAARRKRATAARIDRLKAQQRGDLRKMPLTGKAALKAIRES